MKTFLFILFLIAPTTLRAQSASPFLAGLEAFENHHYSTAEKNFKKVLLESPALKDYSSYFLARTLNAQNKNTESLNYLPLPKKQNRKIEQDIFWEHLETLLALKKWDELNLLLTKHQKETIKNDSEQSRIKFVKIKMFRSQNKSAEAIKLEKDLLINHPGSSYEPFLKTKLTREEQKKRALAFINAGLPKQALTIYDELKMAGENIDEEIAHATFKARDYTKASELYEQLGNNNKQLGTSYGRSDQFNKALEYYQKILKKNNHGREAELARYKIAFIYFDSGQYEKSYTAFDNLINSKQKYKLQESKEYRLWAGYLLKKYEWFINELAALEKKTKDKMEVQKILYWKARALEEQGKKIEAKNIYKNLSNLKPTGYYTALSLQRLKDKSLAPDVLVNTENLSFIPEYEKAPLPSDWMRNLPANHPAFTAVDLANAGLTLYAYQESNVAPLDNLELTDKIDYWQTCQNFTRIMGVGLTTLKVEPPTHLKYHYWTLAYPLAYRSYVEIFSDNVGLDKNITWAIMREESAFKPTTVSSADARGLMQIIPQTGIEITEALQKSFHPDDLNKPEVAIELGTWYLKQRMDEFKNHLPYAIASYNAGPEAVARWQKWGDELPPDLFIELIPYDETRNYVKKVLRSYWVYEALYRSLSALDIPSKTSKSYLSN